MIRRIVVVVGAVVALGLVLNIVGLARFPGGPLREWRDGGALWLDLWPADWGNSSGGNTPEADWAIPGIEYYYTSQLAPNDWPWPVEVERLTPIDPRGDLVVSQALLIRPDEPHAADVLAFGPLAASDQATLAADYAPLPGPVSSGGDGTGIALVFHAPRVGATGWDTLAVDYRVGPFTFRAIHHLALHLCLGRTPEERTCPEAP